jgi:hypothetical protein
MPEVPGEFPCLPVDADDSDGVDVFHRRQIKE